MKYLQPTYIFIYSSWLFLAIQASASVYNSTSLYLENKKSCLASPHLCLKQIDENIGKIKKQSRQWYRLINFKMLAIWEIRDTELLKKELHQYVDLKNAPPVFLTTLYTLHAKMLFTDGNEEQGTLYANRAVELIKKVNNVSFDADRYAEIIILYSQLSQHERITEFIQWINQQIKNMGPPHYFPKLQTAIAHTYINVTNYDLALKHYQYALTGFIETKYHLETAEGYHNVARALQGKKAYDQAIPAFKKALEWMIPAVKMGNYSIEAKNYTQLRLIETLQKNNQNSQAKQLLKEIKPEQLSKNTIALYQQLKSNVPCC
ncbi:tetratricopeptide repeat protein [Cognaticolwellia mytili]|uniref:tetratricopeptide repeat protein n=1 Tax=Cognaticolwellia mytili TaxID=1888913 RepID=UPI000A175BBE|nr:tetratricopeptide repeat protein [Cognaticolwellia mytili]